MSRFAKRRAAFVQEYLVDLSATQAAIRAGYSRRTAGSQGYDLLKNPEIQAAVEKAFRERAERVGLSADQVLAELKAVGLSDMGDYATWGPEGVTLKDSTQLDPKVRRVIAEVSETVAEHGGSKRIKLHDKLAALDKAGQHLRLWGRAADDRDQGPDVYLGDVMKRKAAR